ncbi:MAG: hypothetical protein LC769_08605 [Chloroflexi bacterium]|nr:hypothetical protein [Chloroflexota bacterium]
MNTDELVGQLVWAFISSAQDLTSVEGAVREGRVSGIWLLPTEMHSPGETAALIDRLQAVAPTPLLIGVDAEAGPSAMTPRSSPAWASRSCRGCRTARRPHAACAPSANIFRGMATR